MTTPIDDLAGKLTSEDIANVKEVLDSQMSLDHSMTLMPTDVLARLLDAALAHAAPEGLDINALAMAIHKTRTSNAVNEFDMAAAVTRAELVNAEYQRQLRLAQPKPDATEEAGR